MSLLVRSVTPCAENENAVTEAGDTAMRWNRSRCRPVKWAIAALIGSACDTTTTRSPGWSATTASRAATIRVCIAVIASPPGKVTRDGVRWTTFQRSVVARSASLAPVHSP